MNQLQEKNVEEVLIDLLKEQGYEYFFGPEIAPYTEKTERESFASVVLEKQFKESLQRLNPDVPESARAEAYTRVLNLGSSDLMGNNEKFHTMMSEGVTIEYFQPSPLTPLPKREGNSNFQPSPQPSPRGRGGQANDISEGGMRSEIVKLIDWENVENNSFWVVNQFEIKENGNHKIPDVVLFVNGLPLVVVELKSATSENATLENAYTQIQNYKKSIPSIFYYNALVVLSDGLDARVSSVSAPFSRFLAWKGPKERHGEVIPEMQMMTEEMMRKGVLLKLIRYNTVFETEEKKDDKTGIIKQVKIKKVAAYHQFYAVQKAIEQTLRAVQPSSPTLLPEGEGRTEQALHTIQSPTSIPTSLSSGEGRAVNYRGNFNFSGLIEKARELREKQTKTEEILWSILRNRNFLDLKFRRQHQIGEYIVDFYCNEKKLIIELDGEVHNTEKQILKDHKRDAYLTSLGNKVLRFKNSEVENNLELVLEKIEGEIFPSFTGREVENHGHDNYKSPSLFGRGARGEGYGNRKVGVIWHTQGSGKSLSMVFYAGQLVAHPAMKNPTLVILTDRNDLDDQLFGTFANCQSLLRQKPVQAESRAHLKELLTVSGGGIIFTTIQKFYPADGGEDFETLTERENVVVIADEAHRSQYGFKGRVVETEDGAQTRYGNAKYLRDALPNASFIGFTGTPIEKEDRDTQKVFGEYIDIYDIAQAVKDGATVPISYESRLVKIRLDKKTGDEIDKAINEISNATPEQIQKAKQKNAQVSAIVGHPERLADIAKDVVEHFEARQEVFVGKGMIVVMTRQIAVDLYQQIVRLRPGWHSDDLMKGKIKVVMTSSSDDPASFQPHHTTKQQRQVLAARVKDLNDELDLVIVQSMWLTGFDAPSLHTMYIDKKMQGANLMQAIARVNRVYKDKPGGLIVDYIGIGQDLKNAMATYTESGGKGEAVADIAEVIAGMKEKFEVVEQMFAGFEWRRYFEEDSKGKLQALLEAANFILADEDVKKRFLSAVMQLSKLFAMAVPSFEAEEIRNEVAFFQAVKARISKFTVASGKTDRQVGMAVKQIVDEALSSDGVVDIFEAAGVNAPSLDILSEEFLLEVKNMKQKNLAYELLKKILSEDVQVRKRKNITQAKKFSEMLETAIKKYHNNQIDTAQVIEELSNIAREMKAEDKKAEEMGMTDAEYAFYTVLAENESTSFLKDDVMRELIHLIVETIRRNATVDWEKREDVRAKLRLTVKKLLMKYGYPPDLARIEANKVLEQGELLAEEFVKES